MKLNIALASALPSASAASNCSVASVQLLVDRLNLTGTTNIVTFAKRIDSNTTIQEFKTFVGARNFQTNIPAVCAFRINGSTTAGSKYGFGALLPDTWNERMMSVNRSDTSASFTDCDQGRCTRCRDRLVHDECRPQVWLCRNRFKQWT